VYGDGKQTRSFQYVSDLVGSLFLSINFLSCLIAEERICIWG
jgi:nucleoside-diphosphate-sugar epimerase